MDNLSKEMNLLLNNFWITKEQMPEEYYLLKRKQKELRKFISKNLGSKLIVHDRFIKLEKISNIVSKNQGVEEFTSTMDYVILFIVLLYLEDKPRGEKFILSQLIEYVKNTAITLELSNVPDWTYATHRKSLVRVIKYLLGRCVITLKDEDKISFVEDQYADALYEVTGISNYLIPSFDYEIYDLNKPEEFLDSQWGLQDTAHGDVRRYKVYRNLLYLPVIYKEDISESEDDYLKKMHKTIEKELSDNLDVTVEITKNMAMIYADENTIQKDYFPNTKKVSDIILLINNELACYIGIKNIKPRLDETFVLTEKEFYDILLNTKRNKKAYFSKAILTLTDKKYIKEITSIMENYRFIRNDKQNKTYIIYPLIYHFLGEGEKIKESKNEQIEIFGGEIDEL